MLLIPYQELSADTLDGLIEAFVLREGTEYGEQDISLSDKVAQVKHQLQADQLVILYSELHESVDIITRQQWRQLVKQGEIESDQF
ncbi:MAG: YheU family protein [Gammaproteobacteria bacterium]|nr:YheU family protein [Gammaproteobacteria bacterium]MBU2059224.1 YheU family protein [Gammaproteobacteria bacterium]MBU2173775.1 YheU family protein [Gammaproteobacteria bacterium]MBU2246931.1 YheU family protein [Gammaproteobacteria bacterium]MBU2343501.1 YheU family protein [Gammaproteobacteria bacterium]